MVLSFRKRSGYKLDIEYNRSYNYRSIERNILKINNKMIKRKQTKMLTVISGQ